MSTSTPGRDPNTARVMSTRSATLNSGDFSGLTRMATTMRSKSAAPRSMMSTWPFVNGSKVPG